MIVDVEDIGAPVTEDHKDCDGGPLEDRGIISEMEDKRNQFRLTSWTYLLVRCIVRITIGILLILKLDRPKPALKMTHHQYTEPPIWFISPP